MRLPKLGRAGPLENASVRIAAGCEGFELRSEQLTEPMVFRQAEPQSGIHLVGFLSQKEGGELRVLDYSDEVVETRRYEPVIPMSGAVGGLRGP